MGSLYSGNMTGVAMKNVALVGAGYWGSNLARCIQQSPRLNLSGVVDSDEARASEVGSAFGANVFVEPNLGWISDRRGVEAVVIATPPSSHQEIVATAMEAGLSAYCEKPLTFSSDYWDFIQNAQELTDTVFCPGYVYHSNPVVAFIKKKFEEGVYGDLLRVDVSRRNLGPVRTDTDVVHDLMVHDLYLLSFILGDSLDPVSARGFRNRNSLAIDEVVAYLESKRDFVPIRVASSWFFPRKERLLHFYFEKGLLSWDETKLANQLEWYELNGAEAEYNEIISTHSKFFDSIKSASVLSAVAKDSGDTLQQLIEAFGEALGSGDLSSLPDLRRVRQVEETADLLSDMVHKSH